MLLTIGNDLSYPLIPNQILPEEAELSGRMINWPVGIILKKFPSPKGIHIFKLKVTKKIFSKLKYLQQ